jgi:hypothetical protein
MTNKADEVRTVITESQKEIRERRVLSGKKNPVKDFIENIDDGIDLDEEGG